MPTDCSMRRATCGMLLLSGLLASLAPGAAFAAEPPVAERHRSPVDLVVGPDESWLVTANQMADSLSLVRVEDGRVLDELPIGRHPAALALLPDGKRLLASASYAGEVVLVEVAAEKLKEVARIAVGFEPCGIAVDRAGKLAYVGLAAAGQVAVLDLSEGKAIARIDVGHWPRTLALSPDGSRLAVGTSGEGGITIVDTAERKMLYREKFGALNVGQMQVAADGKKVYFPWTIYRSNPISESNIRRGWVLGSRLGRVALDGPARREGLTLDAQGKAVADGHGLALTPDESRVAITAGGSQELLLFRNDDLPYMQFGDPDHIDPALLGDKDRFARIPLGGRPLNLRVLRDNRTALVANYLFDAVQVVDLDERLVVRELHLGGPKSPSPARQGEAIFYDGKRSLDQWYSCHTCHYEGGGNAEPIDTFNDGSAFTFKTVLPLYQLSETGPWTWHGWQKDLDAAMKKSVVDTMRGREPDDGEVDQLIAFFDSLTPPPNPYRQADGSLSPAAERGRRVFEGETAGCANCHRGPQFTDGEIHDVGLGSSSDRYRGFNTPSLVGAYRKTRWLHDGRARSLEQLLTGPHNPAKVTEKGDLTDDERRDLIEYLKSL